MKKIFILYITLFLINVISIVFANNTFSKEFMLFPESLQWMHKNGFTKYDSEIDYAPYRKITKQEAAKFFVQFAINIFNKTENNATDCVFKDIDETDISLREYVIKSCKLGIFKGSNGYFMPQDIITNADSITIVSKIIFGLIYGTSKDAYINYINKICFDYGSCIGSGEYENFYTTRGDMAMFLHLAKDIKDAILINKEKSKSVASYWKNNNFVFFNTMGGGHILVSGADVKTFEMIDGNPIYDAQDMKNKFSFGQIVQ